MIYHITRNHLLILLIIIPNGYMAKWPSVEDQLEHNETPFVKSMFNSDWEKNLEKLKKKIASHLLPLSSSLSPSLSSSSKEVDYYQWPTAYDYDSFRRDVLPFKSLANPGFEFGYPPDLGPNNMDGVIVPYLPFSEFQMNRKIFGLDQFSEPAFPNFLIPLITGAFLLPFLFLIWINLFQFVAMLKYNLSDSFAEFKSHKKDDILSKFLDKDKISTIFKTWQKSLEKYDEQKKMKN